MLIPTKILDFMQKFKDRNFQIFLVGGTVRGLLMNHDTSDWDFTTDATPDEIMKIFPHSFYENNFGTVGIPEVLNDMQCIFEVTTFRKESNYANSRHPDKVTWTKKIEEDLARRDFTINAIAFDGVSYTDPFDGQSDIKKRVIKAVGEPDNRFQEDALRLLRAVRQAAQLDFEIESETKQSIFKNAAKINSISGERVREELFKLLQSQKPEKGILMLKELELLKNILPELDECFLIDQKSPKRHHIYDVGTHLVNSLSHVQTKDPVTRLATLLHDIGKVKTYRKDSKTGIITFYNHEVIGAQLAETIADRLKLSRDQKNKLCLLIRNHQFTVTEEQSDKSLRRFIRTIGVEMVDDMLDLRRADRLGSGAKETSWRTELFKKRLVDIQVVPFSLKDLKINGMDVMRELSIMPGKRVGEILNQIFNEVDDEKIPNDRTILLKRITELKTS
jgi:poly(A) polymerase/tRNA nucleotidyltransferase (CCA-adding enzyme)